jgi:hypothetical protein
MDHRRLQKLREKMAQSGGGFTGHVPSFTAPPALPSVDPDLVQKSINQSLAASTNRGALKDILTNSLLSLALGGGAAYFATQGQRPPSETKRYSDLRKIELAPPRKKENEKRSQDMFKQLGDTVSSFVPNLFTNPEAKNLEAVPGYVAARVLAPIGAGIAGWAGVRGYLNKNRGIDTKKRVDTAKQNYEKALRMLQGQEDDREDKQEKQSADQLLDQLFENMTKESSLNDTWKNLLGQYLIYAGISAPAGYMLVDNYMQGSNKNKLVEKAIRERERRHSVAQPSRLRAYVPHDEDESMPTPESKEPKKLEASKY